MQPAEEGASQESAVASAEGPGGGLRLPVWCWLSLWLTLWVGASVALHYALHGVVNGWQVALAFFLAVNILICVWEISLYYRIGDIERWHREPRETSGRPRGSVFLASASFG